MLKLTSQNLTISTCIFIFNVSMKSSKIRVLNHKIFRIPTHSKQKSTTFKIQIQTSPTKELRMPYLIQNSQNVLHFSQLPNTVSSFNFLTLSSIDCSSASIEPKSEFRGDRFSFFFFFLLKSFQLVFRFCFTKFELKKTRKQRRRIRKYVIGRLVWIWKTRSDGQYLLLHFTTCTDS